MRFLRADTSAKWSNAILPTITRGRRKERTHSPASHGDEHLAASHRASSSPKNPDEINSRKARAGVLHQRDRRRPQAAIHRQDPRDSSPSDLSWAASSAQPRPYNITGLGAGPRVLFGAADREVIYDPRAPAPLEGGSNHDRHPSPRISIQVSGPRPGRSARACNRRTGAARLITSSRLISTTLR